VKPVILHSEARAELDEAVAYYEGLRLGLGVDLLSEVEKGIARIQQNPKLFPVYKDTDFRKCLVNRFPYLIFYQELDDKIWIIAIAHGKRRPDYWKARSIEQ
jgi:toxin ParE1/3/4